MSARKPKRFARWLLVCSGIAALSLGGFVFLGRQTLQTDSPPGRDILARPPGYTADFSALEKLRWEDVSSTLMGTCAEPGMTDQVLAAASGSTNPAVIYVRGVLLLGKGNQAGALTAFDRLNPELIPSTLLYAPYRLQGGFNPGASNSFRGTLVRAALSGQLPPLLRARLMVSEANLKTALQAYLQSDPGQWTGYDVSLFPALLQHAGLERDARALLQAALRGGRVEPALRAQLQTLASSRDGTAASKAFTENFLALLHKDPETQQRVGQAAARQAELRRQFVTKQYDQLLRSHSATDPSMQPDETLLLLSLSAARQANVPAFDRWTQELKRRYPQPEVQQWLNSLKTPAS